MGPAAVQITILPNAGALRSADIVVAGQALPVTQSAPAAPVPVPTPPGEPVPPTQPAPTPCSYAVSPLQGSFGAAGGSGSISVSTGAGCTWAPVSSATWVVVTSGLSGTGNGQIGYLVTANLSTSSREATITVGGISHRVSQAGVTTTSGPTVDIDGSVGGLSGTCPVLRFTVRGTVVTTDAATKFDDGTCQDLRNGLGVHVKGTRQADGSIHAREVEIDD
jgi:hypothetical protein